MTFFYNKYRLRIPDDLILKILFTFLKVKLFTTLLTDWLIENLDISQVSVFIYPRIYLISHEDYL